MTVKRYKIIPEYKSKFALYMCSDKTCVKAFTKKVKPTFRITIIGAKQ